MLNIVDLLLAEILRLHFDALRAENAGEHSPPACVESEIDRLMVSPPVFQPGINRLPNTVPRPEMEIWHWDIRELFGVQYHALADHEPVIAAAYGRQGDER
jgi:hypothetical protein